MSWPASIPRQAATTSGRAGFERVHPRLAHSRRRYESGSLRKSRVIVTWSRSRIGDGRDRHLVEGQDRRAREGHQDRRVGHDDALCASLLDDLAEHRQERELTQRRERRLGLVEEVQAVRDESGLEEVEESLAVRPIVEVAAVHRRIAASSLRYGLRARSFAYVRCAGVDDIDVPEPLLQSSRSVDIRLANPKKSSARRKKPRRVRFDQDRLSESARRRTGPQRLVAIQVRAARRDDPGRRGDRFEERGLAGSVLPDEERDRRRELDRGAASGSPGRRRGTGPHRAGRCREASPAAGGRLARGHRGHAAAYVTPGSARSGRTPAP